MSLILNIETATRNCSVAISSGDQVLSLREISGQGYSHAEKLHVFIEETVNQAGIKLTDLSAVAVSKGPGSYTGLRIGVSAAKGLCFALGIPLISVDTLTVIASQSNLDADFIIPMIDARRMEAYTAIFDRQLNCIRGVEAEILDENSYLEINGKIAILGDCQQKAATVLTDPRFTFDAQVEFPSAGAMAKISDEKLRANHFEDVAYFEPFYLKDFLAK